jgi:hypothetical protein
MALRTVGSLMIVLLCALGASAAEIERALMLRLGTTGIGLDSGTLLNYRVGLRLGGTLFNYGIQQTESDITYDAHLKLRSLHGLVDIHPTGGAFRLTGGLVYNKNRVEATAVPTGGTFELDGVTYPASQVGTLKAVGRIGSRTWAPYAGLGFGRAGGEKRVFFVLDLGVIFQGQPTIELSATGPLAASAAFQADLQAETADTNADLADGSLRYYPVLSAGIGFRF